MPFINAKLSCSLSAEQQEALKQSFGKSMELIGKSESWLMVDIQQGCNLYFQGNKNSDSAIISVSLLGNASKDQYANMTHYLCNQINLCTNISPDRIYVKYEEVDNWGWNFNNF